MNHSSNTIVAIASGSGGAISLIRISGAQAIDLTERFFTACSKQSLVAAKGFTLHYGTLRNEQNEVIDDVLVSVFHAPHSYTGEEMIEISCHASPFIQQEILRLCILHGARMAEPGEFTLRAFLAGKMDLSQAEAVADVIAADSKASLRLASNQMRGGYSAVFGKLREKLIHLVSLLELELDFSEEEVEFADRRELHTLLERIERQIQSLSTSFRLGNVLKNGVPVAITGSPNVGKSTLLNALLGEERALVSEIAGTTRDTLEETINIHGIIFRFIDTAGIRTTEDPLENMGIQRTYQRIEQARIVLLMTDATQALPEITDQVRTLANTLRSDQHFALLLNKSDKATQEVAHAKQSELSQRLSCPVIALSAKQQTNIDLLTDLLYRLIQQEGNPDAYEPIVSNARHHAALEAALKATHRAQQSLDSSLPEDLLSQDIREILHHLSIITGEITSQDILTSIFSKFCIGK